MAGPGSDRELVLGRSRTSDETLALPARALLRHMMALGSSGSGKTVLSKVVVEEIVRAGVPALCLDPQGDLCSLALVAEDPDALAARGVDPALAREFAERCEVVIFTPASKKGVALGADPLAAALAGKDVQQAPIDEEQWTRAAGTIAERPPAIWSMNSSAADSESSSLSLPRTRSVGAWMSARFGRGRLGNANQAGSNL